MVTRADAQIRRLMERVEELETRIRMVGDYGAQHGVEHFDTGRDPIVAALIEGHSHAETVPTVESVATSTETSFTTSHTVSLPPNIRQGDLLIVFFGRNAGAATWPGGWTEIVKTSGAAPFEARYKVADGTEGTTITITTDSSGTSTHNSYRIAGQAGNPPEGAGATATSANADPPTLSPTGGSKNYLWITAAAAKADITAIPSSYGNAVEADGSDGAGGDFDCYSGSRANTAASENPGTFTHSSGAWSALTVAVYPSAQHSGAADTHHDEHRILDNDSDTYWTVEESTDDDNARLYQLGVERVLVDENAYLIKTIPLQLKEISTPTNPAEDSVRIFARDNGNDIDIVARSATGAECTICTLTNVATAAGANTLTLNWIE